jgi:hypothetical protein
MGQYIRKSRNIAPFIDIKVRGIHWPMEPADKANQASATINAGIIKLITARSLR